MRTTIINIEPDEFRELAHKTDIVELTEAIGYLATWGMTGTGYDKVQIRMAHAYGKGEFKFHGASVQLREPRDMPDTVPLCDVGLSLTI